MSISIVTTGGVRLKKRHTSVNVSGSSNIPAMYELDVRKYLATQVTIRFDSVSNVDRVELRGVRGGNEFYLDSFTQPGANVDYDFIEIISRCDRLRIYIFPKLNQIMTYNGVVYITFVGV